MAAAPGPRWTQASLSARLVEAGYTRDAKSGAWEAEVVLHGLLKRRSGTGLTKRRTTSASQAPDLAVAGIARLDQGAAQGSLGPARPRRRGHRRASQAPCQQPRAQEPAPEQGHFQDAKKSALQHQAQTGGKG